MHKKFLLCSSIATTLVASATALSGYLLSSKLMYIKQKDPAFILERETKAKRFDQDWFNACPKNIIAVESKNGYMLSGIYLKPLTTSDTIIICHGVTENKFNSIKYARMFEKMGFNTVVYDHRRHGETGGKTTSYGYYEKLDLQQIVVYVREQIGPHAKLGIHGESMGAATTLLYAGDVADEADFYIADSAFSDFQQLLFCIMKNSISVEIKPAVYVTDILLRLRDGYTSKQISPIAATPNIIKPVLFLHNKFDTFIPASMSEDLFAAKVGDKMLHLFDVGDHTQAYNETPDEYEKVVNTFLQQYVLPTHYHESA
ncbi:MAG: alpha/beta fold hydrolase [Lysinibacillus sp.]